MSTHYDFNEHRHRYASWTASRAVQRSFTNTNNICKAINASGLRRFAETKEIYTVDQFDIDQNLWCHQLIESFTKMNVACTYGRAAKIVAIYLKTSVVLPANGKTDNALAIHPPIDSILLRSIAKKTSLSHLRIKRWTQFSEDDYFELVGELRHRFGWFNWTLEEHWKPEEEPAIALSGE